MFCFFLEKLLHEGAFDSVAESSESLKILQKWRFCRKMPYIAKKTLFQAQFFSSDSCILLLSQYENFIEINALNENLELILYHKYPQTIHGLSMFCGYDAE